MFRRAVSRLRPLSLQSEVTTRFLATSTPEGRRGVLLTKFYYFLYFTALGTIVPFFNVYLKEIGLSGTQIGLLGSVSPFILFIASPVWGGIVDRWRAQRLVLTLGAVIGGATSLLFLTTRQFALLVAISATMVFFRNPLSGVVDSVAVTLSQRENVTYGQQRTWGSVGFVLASYGIAQLVTSQNLALTFWLHAILLIAGCAVLGWFLPVENSATAPDLWRGLRTMIKNRSYRSLLIASFLQGMGSTCYFSFLGLHLLALGGHESQIGLAYAANALAEVPIMMIPAAWLARYASRNLITLGLLGGGVVWLLVALAGSPLQVILISTALGICYGIQWMTSVRFANEAAAEGLRASSQALLGAAQYGLGWGLGALIAGLVWDAAGGHVLFALAALLVWIGAGIFWWGSR